MYYSCAGKEQLVRWLTMYVIIYKTVHEIMMEPLIEKIGFNKEFGKKIRTEAWYTNQDKGIKSLDVYIKLYNDYGLTGKQFESRINMIRFELDWRIKQWHGIVINVI